MKRNLRAIFLYMLKMIKKIYDNIILMKNCFNPNFAVNDRSKRCLISGAEKQLILRSTSALNPPGMRNLKMFLNQLPYNWIVFYEKSRYFNTCAINMNTVVHPALIALQCGRHCSIFEDDFENWRDSQSASEDELLRKALRSLSSHDRRRALMTLDQWICFDMLASEAKTLMLLRTLIDTQFQAFLRYGHLAQTGASAFCLQKLLSSL